METMLVFIILYNGCLLLSERIFQNIIILYSMQKGLAGIKFGESTLFEHLAKESLTN